MHKSWLQSFCMSHCPLYQVPYSCDPLLMVCICFQVAIALHVKLRLLDVFQIGLLLAAVLEAWSPGEVHVGPPGLSQIFACLAYFSDGWIGNRRCRFLHPHRQFLKVVPIQSLERKITVVQHAWLHQPDVCWQSGRSSLLVLMTSAMMMKSICVGLSIPIHALPSWPS